MVLDKAQDQLTVDHYFSSSWTAIGGQMHIMLHVA
jgi:hypothetical protein